MVVFNDSNSTRFEIKGNNKNMAKKEAILEYYQHF